MSDDETVQKPSGISWNRPFPFIGRKSAMDLFREVLPDHHVKGILIHGLSGVGKTRLAQECLERAKSAGFDTAMAVATHAAAAVPLGAIAHIIPRGIDLTDPVAGFHAIEAGIGRRNRKGRLVLLVDDLHLLDSTSVMLLRQLMDSGNVFLLGTVRSGEPLSSHSALCQGDCIRRLDIAAFTEKQVAAVLEAALQGSVARHTAHQFYAISGGNALYLRELTLGALRSDALRHDGEVWHLTRGGSRLGTPRLRELIAARLGQATPRGTAVLELLALCEPVSLADARAVAAMEDLAELERWGYMRTTREGKRQILRLEHPLYGEMIRAGSPTLRQHDVLLQQIARIEARGARRQDDLRNIASWRLSATGTADPRLLVQAATLARHSRDYPQVIRLLEAVPEREHTVESWLSLSSALIETGQSKRAGDILNRTLSLAATDREKLAVVDSWSANMIWGMGSSAKALQLTAAVREQLTSPEASDVLAAIDGSAHVAQGSPVAGLRLLDEFLRCDAAAANDLDAWLKGAVVKTWALQMLGRTQEAVTWAKRTVEIHERAARETTTAPDPALQKAPLLLALAEGGHLPEARASGERQFAELIRSDSDFTRMWLAYFLAVIEWLAGRAASSRRWYAECAALARSHHRARPLREALGGLSAAASVLGDSASAEAALAELRTMEEAGREADGVDCWDAPSRALGHAWQLVLAGHLTRARDVLGAAARAARAGGDLSAEGMLLTDIARLGGAGQAENRLREIADQCDAALARTRAAFASALAAEDAPALLSVSEQFEDMGYELLAAEAAAGAAAAFRGDGRPRQATAASLRCTRLADACQGISTPGLALAQGGAPLTRREAEVAWLAAAGETTQHIAEKLTLSTRTVSNHLGRVYDKLGVSSRRDLRSALAHRPDPDQPPGAGREE
ncbi:LuxR C-terminal-related transcriptional regulator [Streptomyces sp. NPDC001381]|uniref:helix-turn-helix transcriptional regulator n=1 Tax=Streptomyces sp. NPDC001381 TaxID=3364567 RepID=UPI0036C9D591